MPLCRPGHRPVTRWSPGGLRVGARPKAQADGRVPEDDRHHHDSERSHGSTRGRASSTEGAAVVASACRVRSSLSSLAVAEIDRGTHDSPQNPDSSAAFLESCRWQGLRPRQLELDLKSRLLAQTDQYEFYMAARHG